MHTELAVLGGGPGGYAAAFLAADLGMQVTLIEADPRLGGTCLLRGCIPSKALLHVARVISESREMAEWGVDFGQPALDLAKLRARKEKILSTLSGGLKQLAKKRRVQVIHARGVLESSQSLRLDDLPADSALDKHLSFDHCIVATGSSPARIKSLSLPSERVMDSTSALELSEVPSSLLVVGGGYIGLELGTVYAELGSRVTVVELTDGLLPGCDRDLVKPLHERLRKRFEAILLETKVAKLVDRESAIEVVLEGPEGSQTATFDRVLVAVGRRPNSTDLGLETTNVEIDERGFVISDVQQRTADPHILAIGDVTREPMLAHKASREAKIAVEALHGAPAVFDNLAIPAVVFTDPEIAWAGLTETEAERDNRQVEVVRYPWAASGRAQALGRTDGLTKFLVDPATERILGVGIVGVGAGELIAEGVLAIEMGCTIRDVTESIHPHPTLSETLAFTGETFLGLATEIYRPRRQRAEA